MANAERLQKLRELAVNQDEEMLRMDAWSQYDPDTCGTAYCLAGLAAVNPWFRQNTEILTIFATNEGGGVWEATRETFDRLANLFDISKDDARRLFGASLHPGDEVWKQDVIENLDRVIAGKPAFCYV